MKIVKIVFLSLSLLLVNFTLFSNLNIQLVSAIKSGDKDLVTAILQQGSIDLNLKDKDGYTPLMHAVLHQNFDIAKILIAAGSDLNTQNNQLNSPLIKGAEYGNTEIVKLLIQAGANLNLKNSTNNTAYSIAKSNKDSEIMNVFHEQIAEYKQRLYLAIENNNIQEFKDYLLKIGSVHIKDDKNNNLLHRAAMARNKDVFALVLVIDKSLISQKNSKDMTPIEILSAMHLEFFSDLFKYL